MIDEAKVRHVAKIARINLSDEEVKKFSKQLNDVVESFKILDELDIENVAPSFHPIKTENVLREDLAKKGLEKKQVFRLACHEKDGHFKSPKVI
ncbi:MAG: Asp-tRNA(Asn)/Glu-tRNA(Gln) amidotransferase subunit GatC [Candidatus Nanoarchaeia archaeon]|nr:Asp-tRNA(Asn)/Glu-tRNA(Gln) amidotransferase subunit GatC [Candidatus Nanoarchaeia archaeon]MDD5054369.1 Asp-tRNA(Asn)/Glu-tRNA(Gln) amidotransferase subunit GatC [Candidatus Nanoarchaeia archaeon]MDD5499875.1 Asp-tRNA(Asn)/Glu-tRNA(Gln) amidotransferase subunit GatC [Candidatus Nanoarchaeia archaeon]